MRRSARHLQDQPSAPATAESFQRSKSSSTRKGSDFSRRSASSSEIGTRTHKRTTESSTKGSWTLRRAFRLHPMACAADPQTREDVMYQDVVEVFHDERQCLAGLSSVDFERPAQGDLGSIALASRHHHEVVMTVQNPTGSRVLPWRVPQRLPPLPEAARYGWQSGEVVSRPRLLARLFRRFQLRPGGCVLDC